MTSTDVIKSIIMTMKMTKLTTFTSLAEVVFLFLTDSFDHRWNKHQQLYGYTEIMVSIANYKNDENDKFHQPGRGCTLFLINSFNSRQNNHRKLYGFTKIIISTNNVLPLQVASNNMIMLIHIATRKMWLFISVRLMDIIVIVLFGIQMSGKISIKGYKACGTLYFQTVYNAWQTIQS